MPPQKGVDISTLNVIETDELDGCNEHCQKNFLIMFDVAFAHDIRKLNVIETGQDWYTSSCVLVNCGRKW